MNLLLRSNVTQGCVISRETENIASFFIVELEKHLH